jgi:hypothetical protein
MVNAGFGKRIMFGSDNMILPQTIEIGIKTIEKAIFLTPQQKRDILFNNAARFLRLTEKELKICTDMPDVKGIGKDKIFSYFLLQ